MDKKQIILRYASLTVLTLQTTMTVLTMRYSRMHIEKDSSGGAYTSGNPSTKSIYIASTLVLISEVIKFALCIGLLFIQKSFSFQQTSKCILNEVLKKPAETGKLSIPSTLYTIQNNLIILALSYLDAATYQVTYQLKILTTAFFSVAMLRKDLKISQWFALVVLMFGVVLVQFPAEKAKGSSNTDFSPVSEKQRLIGLAAILVSSLSSGFAGVYYEKLLKESSQPSVIIRNLQLGLFSVVFGAVGVIVTDWERVLKLGFFFGYTPVVWLVVMLQASGGLLVAAVIKFADNILKGFATSISIILSCLYSYVIFGDLILDSHFVAGTALVIGATFLYGFHSHRLSSSASPPVDSDSKVPLMKNPPWETV